MNVPLDALALAELEAVAKLEPPAGPLNFTTPVDGMFKKSAEELGENEGASAFNVGDNPAIAPCCPYGGKYVGAGVDGL